MTSTNTADGARQRISHQDRRRTAEGKILDAAVSILIDDGYAAVTTLQVQRQAGVSRGQLLHYYGSRADLIRAATRHLYANRIGELLVRAAELSTTDTASDDPISLLWEMVSGPLGRACLELWAAARHDDELHDLVVSLEREMGRANLEMCRALFGESLASHERFQEFCLVLINSMIGTASSAVPAQPAASKHVLDSWRHLAQIMLNAA